MLKQDMPGRILVIDDQEQTRYILRRLLTRAGYAIEEAETGSRGLEAAMSVPDLIILDVNLPDMLGYDVCRRLRSNPLTASIPVLQISASFTSDESKVQALQGGADSYLTQPIEPTVLLAQVQALLRLRRAEAVSNLSSRQWQTTFDGLSEGLALVDSSDHIIRANRTFLRLSGMTTTELEGQSLASVLASRFEKSFDDLLREGVADHPVEVSSNSRWFRIRYDKIDADPQTDGGAVLLVTEITEHRKLQETVKMSERLAATGRLAHIIAHEINNPLEAITNLLYLTLSNMDVTDSNHEFLQQASTEIERIGQITKQVLAFHRESKEPIVVEPSEMLDGVLAMFRVQMLSTGITLVSDTRCHIKLRVNPGEIRQVFGNLVANALDAIGPQGGRLHVRCFESREQRTGQKGARFVFSDSGEGIPATVLPEIFNAFYTTKQTKGSGIGLWLTSEVIEKHRGSIRLRTRTDGPYRGTLIEVFLPAAL